MLQEFGRSMLTTWNLGKQCVEPVRVSDDAFQRVLGILEMPEGRRHCQALTQSEVLHFMGWLPYRTRKEFDEYRTEHPDLESFPPYYFRVSRHASEEEPEDEGGVLQGHSPYVSDQGTWLSASNAFCCFASMATDTEKERYKNLLAKDKAKAKAQQKKQPVVPWFGRPTCQPAPPKPQQQQQ